MHKGQKFHHYLKALTESNAKSMKALAENKIISPDEIEGCAEITELIAKPQGGKLKPLFRAQFAIYSAFQLIENVKAQKIFEHIDFDYNRNKSMFHNLELDSIEECKDLSDLCDIYYQIAEIKNDLNNNSSKFIALEQKFLANEKLKYNITLAEDLDSLKKQIYPPHQPINSAHPFSFLSKNALIVGTIILACGSIITAAPVLAAFIDKKFSIDLLPVGDTILNYKWKTLLIGTTASIIAAVITATVMDLVNKESLERE